MESGQVFVLAIIAISTLGGIGSMWVRARHGLPIEDYRGRRGRLRNRLGLGIGQLFGQEEEVDTTTSTRKIELLSSENERLTGQIGRLEERLRVLERIATDPAERTAREIDALRDS